MTRVRQPERHGQLQAVLRNGPSLRHGTWMFKRAVFEKLRGYRFDLSEDYDFLTRMDTAGLRFGNLPEALYGYRSHQDSTELRKGAGLRSIKSHIYVRKQYRRRQRGLPESHDEQAWERASRSTKLMEWLDHAGSRWLHRSRMVPNRWLRWAGYAVGCAASPYVAFRLYEATRQRFADASVRFELPKTATTSLQRNVLMPWHRSGRINFLGRCAWQSGRTDELHDRLDAFRSQLGTARLAAADADALRPAIERLLDPDRLNVISDERMAGMETVGKDAEFRAEAWLDNLRAVFRGTEATLLVCLRSPADFVLAAYAEDYCWRFHGLDRYDTFPKFVEELLAADRATEEWMVFFYNAHLRAARRRFLNVAVLLYEDLLHDPRSWYVKLGRHLEAEPGEIERLLSAERHNVGTRTAVGRRSRPLTVGHIARKLLRDDSSQPIHTWPLRLPFLPCLYRRFAGLQLPLRAHHRYPDDGGLRGRVLQRLGLQHTDLADFGINADKLARYGYLRCAA